MKILKEHLLKAIEFPIRLANGKKSIPILNCIYLEASKGTLTVRASDISSFVSLQAGCEGYLPSVCIPAARIAVPLANASAEYITMELDGNMLKLDVGDKISMATIESNEFPEVPKRNGKNIGIDCEILSKAIKSVKWAVSTDTSREALMCVNVETKAKSFLAQAINGRQMAFYQEPLLCAEMDVSIPTDYCGPLANFLMEEKAMVHLTDKAIMSVFDRGFYSCQMLNMNYLNSSVLREAEYEKIGTLDRDEVLTKFRSITGCCSANIAPKVLASFTSKGATFEMSNSAETFFGSIEGSFKEAECGLNAQAFCDCLESLEAGSKIELSHDPKTKVLLQCGNLSAISAQLL